MTQQDNNSSVIASKTIFISFCLYFVIGILRATNIDFPKWSAIAVLFQLIALGLIMICVILETYRRKLKFNFFFFLCFAVGIINCLITKHTFMLGFSVLFFGFAIMESGYWQLSFNDLFLRFMIVLTTVFFIIFISSVIGIIDMGYSSRENISRYNFGFQTATLAPAIFFFITLGFIYLYKERTSWTFLLFAFSFAFFLYYASDTRTGFFLTVCTISLCVADKCLHLQNLFDRLCESGIFRFLVLAIPFFVLVFDALLVGYYSTFTPLAFKLNNLLSTRLSLTLNLIEKEGFSLFGKLIPGTVNGEYYQSDICYFYYALNYGLLSLAIALYLEVRLLWKSLNERNMWIMLSTTFIILDGIFEPYLLDYKYQIFAFMLAIDMLRKKNTSFQICYYTIERSFTQPCIR